MSIFYCHFVAHYFIQLVIRPKIYHTKIYKEYSKLIPKIGKLIVGEKEPYEYLVESIDKFINQEELIELLKSNNFQNCSYRNLSGGIVAIHSGWKL